MFFFHNSRILSPLSALEMDNWNRHFFPVLIFPLSKPDIIPIAPINLLLIGMRMTGVNCYVNRVLAGRPSSSCPTNNPSCDEGTQLLLNYCFSPTPNRTATTLPC